MTSYGLPEGYGVISNKSAYTYDDNWDNVAKVVSPGIRKMKVSNVACVFPILFSIYLNIHLYPSKFSSDVLIPQSSGHYSHMMSSCLK